MIPQTPEQWGMALFAAGIVGGVVMALWVRWDYLVDETIRNAYKGAGVAYDDADLAADEQAWREWADVCGVLGITPDHRTPIYDRLVCDEMEHAEGWAS